MKQSTVDTSFYSLRKKDIEDTYGGRTTIIYYKDENGVIKIRLVVVN